VQETLIRRFRSDGKGHEHPGYRPVGTDHLASRRRIPPICSSCAWRASRRTDG
jgi:hypothetical protein